MEHYPVRDYSVGKVIPEVLSQVQEAEHYVGDMALDTGRDTPG